MQKLRAHRVGTQLKADGGVGHSAFLDALFVIFIAAVARKLDVALDLALVTRDDRLIHHLTLDVDALFLSK